MNQLRLCLALLPVLAGAVPHPSADNPEIPGTALGEFSNVNAQVARSSAQRYIESLRSSGRAIPEEAAVLMAAAGKALEQRDNYRAFRLIARAAASARGEDHLESFEVAASLQMFLNRAILTDGETFALTLRPLFTLGHPLADRYTVLSWLETAAGPIAGTERKLSLTELKEVRFDYPVQPLKDGIVAAAYRLESSEGETLVEFRRAVLVAKDGQSRLERLKAGLAAAEKLAGANPSPALVSALDTIRYHAQNLEQERTRFEWGFQREFHPFAAYLSVKANPVNNVWAAFPEFRGRVRYPQDIDFAESLAVELRADQQALMKRNGDMALAYRTTAGELIRYRIYVPTGADPSRGRSLIIALHSGEGDSFYFDREALFAGVTPAEHAQNRFKQLAQERGYIVAVPNGGRDWGFASERGEADVLELADALCAAYSIAPDRVFLTGWSGGGGASWRIAVHHPERFGGAAPVGNEAPWLTRENTTRARDLRVLYSVAETEAATGQKTAALARDLLPNFTYREFPKTEHATVWYAALPAVFDFFDAAQGGLKIEYPGAGAPPGDEPQVFAKGIVSVDGKNTHAVQFSPDGRFLVFSRYPDGTSFVMTRSANGWSQPEPTSFKGKEVSFDSVLQRLYYYDRGDLFFVRYDGSRFSEPVRLPPAINTPAIKFYPSVTARRNLYFSRDGNWKTGRVLAAKMEGGGFGIPVDVGEPVDAGGAIHAFVAPDESYMLFNSPRPGSHTQNDIWVSFRGQNGSWMEPMNLGERINREARAVLCPTVTPDGKYLFFTRLQESGTGYVYWVSARIVEQLRPALLR